MNIVGTKRDQGREQASPHALDRPSPEAIIDGCRRAIDRWAVLPATARLQHMDDAADQPLITRRSSTRCAPGWLFGKSGSITAPCRSDNQNSPAMIYLR